MGALCIPSTAIYRMLIAFYFMWLGMLADEKYILFQLKRKEEKKAKKQSGLICETHKVTVGSWDVFVFVGFCLHFLFSKLNKFREKYISLTNSCFEKQHFWYAEFKMTQLSPAKKSEFSVLLWHFCLQEPHLTHNVYAHTNTCSYYNVNHILQHLSQLFYKTCEQHIWIDVVRSSV